MNAAPDDPGRIRFDLESLRCEAALPTTRLLSSLDAGWTSVHMELHRAASRAASFETHPTSDQTIVVAWRGMHEVQSWRAGRWRGATYRPGSVGMTPGGETARLRWSSPASPEPVETLHLYLPQGIILEVADEHRGAGLPLPDAPLSVLCYDDPAVARTCEAMLDAMAAGAADLYAAASARWLAAHLLFRHSTGFAPGDRSRGAGWITEPRLARVLDFMRAHLAEPLTLDDLSREAGVSKFHFSRLFRDRTGQTPHACLMRLRLEAAADLLRRTDRRVDDVARACGFKTAAHFATAFAKCHGLSPREFRSTRRP